MIQLVINRLEDQLWLYRKIAIRSVLAAVKVVKGSIFHAGELLVAILYNAAMYAENCVHRMRTV